MLVVSGMLLKPMHMHVLYVCRSYGGWVAPNIYYLGNAGVVKYGGLRIAGLSGIYKPFDYDKSKFSSVWELKMCIWKFVDEAIVVQV